MKYDHLIKYNGVVYPAGAEVPVGEPAPKIELNDTQITFETDAVAEEKPHVGRPRKQK